METRCYTNQSALTGGVHSPQFAGKSGKKCLARLTGLLLNFINQIRNIGDVVNPIAMRVSKVFP